MDFPSSHRFDSYTLSSLPHHSNFSGRDAIFAVLPDDFFIWFICLRRIEASTVAGFGSPTAAAFRLLNLRIRRRWKHD